MATADLNFYTHIFMCTKQVPLTILGLWLFLWLYLMEVPVRIVMPDDCINLKNV